MGIVVIFFLHFPTFSINSTFSITTNDGLKITFSDDGFIDSVKIDGKKISDKPYQPFWIRDFTPDYEIK